MSRDVWSSLLEHVESCRVPSCKCVLFARNIYAWSRQLPLCSECPDVSWLSYSAEPGKPIQWQCAICVQDSLVEARWHGGEPKFGNMHRHAHSASHRNAVARYLGRPSDEVAPSAPPVTLFQEVFNLFKDGVCPRNGFTVKSGAIIGRSKVERMVWALAEANLQSKQEQVGAALISANTKSTTPAACHRLPLVISI